MAGLTEKNKRAIPSERPRWYVYHLIDPRDSRVFYVGKGCGDRIKAHEAEARLRPYNLSPKLERIRAIWAAGMDVQRFTVAWFWDKRDAFRFERREIMERRDSLTNIWWPGRAIEEPRSWSAELSAALDAFIANDRAEIEYRRPRIERLVERSVEEGNANGIEIGSKLMEAAEKPDPWAFFNEYLTQHVFAVNSRPGSFVTP